MANKSWQLNSLVKLLRKNDPQKLNWKLEASKYVRLVFLQISSNGRIIDQAVRLKIEPITGEYFKVHFIPLNGISLDIHANTPKMLLDKLVYHQVISQNQLNNLIAQW